MVKTHKAPGGIKFARGEGLKQIKTLTCWILPNGISWKPSKHEMEQTLLIMLKMIDKTCQMELGIQIPLVLCLAQVSHIVHKKI